MQRQAKQSPFDPVLARSTMHSRYGGVLKLVFEHLFGPIHYPAQSAEMIRALSQRGVLVYVARARSTLLGLYFNYALSRLGLPLASFVGGLNLLLWQPVGRLWTLWRQRRRGVSGPWSAGFTDRPPTRSEALLADISLRGETSFIFLGERRPNGHSAKVQSDYVRALVAAQRRTATPIFAVPHALASRIQGGAVHHGLADRLFGNRRHPGRLRYFVMFFSTLRRASVRVGDPVCIADYVAAHPDLGDVALARMIRHDLSRRIREEERVIAGPELLTHHEVARHVLRDPHLRAVVTEQAAGNTEQEAALLRQAAAYLKEIGANYSGRTLRWVDQLVAWIFNRIYDGVMVDEAGLAQVIEASRSAPVIFCPSHRSHIDYLALSSVLWRHGVAPPHIAAGANLAFFPLGPIFRRCGAFFLRRSFRDNKLYDAVFRAYVAELLKNGTSIEFFLEGTRSRTGKLLMPRFGILSMLVGAWRRGARDDILFVPVSVDYERIIEAGAYERELLGGEKPQEDIGGLLRSARVLRSRYGRVHMQFGEPLSLKARAAAKGLAQSSSAAHDAAWRRETERLGYRILHAVAGVCSVTPTAVVATALLTYTGRGLSETRLVEYCGAIIDYLVTATARLSESLSDPAHRSAAVLEAVQTLVHDGQVKVDRAGHGDTEPIYRVPEERRIQLDYHKNSLMNHFAPAAILARVIARRSRTDPEAPLDCNVLHTDVRFLARLFKREFIYRVDATFDSHFDDTLATFAVRGVVDVHDDGRIVVREPNTIAVLAGLLDSFVQAYWITARTLGELRAFPLWDKELRTRALEHARREFLEGTISRPEAANRTTISTALGWLVEAGVVEAVGSGKRRTLQLTTAYSAEGLDRLVDDIAAYL